MATAKKIPLASQDFSQHLQVLRSWNPEPEGAQCEYLPSLMQVLEASEGLADLQLPLEVCLSVWGPDLQQGSQQLAELHDALQDVQRTLGGFHHRLRVAGVRERAPGHAKNLEEVRCRALAHVGTLLMRTAFLRQELERSDLHGPLHFTPFEEPPSLLLQ